MKERPAEHVSRNRAYWDRMAHEWAAAGERLWRSEPVWGIWEIPEAQLGLLPELQGRDAIELGCGTGYVSAWMARRGASVFGIDNSSKQLETARGLQHRHGVHFPLLHGNAESVPLPDASFDFAISEHGAVVWCDPYLWIPEAARLLRPAGRLVALAGSPVLMMCVPDYEDQPPSSVLLRPWFGMHRFEWPDSDGVECHLNHGDRFRLLQDSGFDVVGLLEIQPPPGDSTRFSVPNAWARRWPSEEVWIADRRR